MSKLIDKTTINFVETFRNETGIEMPKDFFYSLGDLCYMNRGLKDCGRTEIILPKDITTHASYVLGFQHGDAYYLADSLMIRMNKFPQSFMVLVDESNIRKVVKELRKVYDEKNPKRNRFNLPIPKRTNEWGYIEDRIYKNGTLEFFLIKPLKTYSLAEEFEMILRKYDMIKILEEKGYPAINGSITEEAATMEMI